MPEYGRGIQNMVDYALTLKSRSERQRCAYTIVSIMGNMFPHLRDVPDFKHKLWDHLAVMADYKLDIDYPYEIRPKQDVGRKPEPMAYPMKKIRYRHYGALLDAFDLSAYTHGAVHLDVPRFQWLYEHNNKPSGGRVMVGRGMARKKKRM